ncbi:MAG: hypothetical protein R3B45_06460 [Bdellovibrionota bacterium]
MGISGCSEVEPSGGLSAQKGSGEANADDGKITTASKEATYNAFKTTVFPLVTEHCGACHGVDTSPKFAIKDDYIASHDALDIDGDAPKVDFSNPDHSRIVQRLSPETHNCWGDCKENAAEMTAAIEAWASQRSSTTSTKKLSGIATDALPMSSIRKNKVANLESVGIIAFEAESGILTGNLIEVSDSTASEAKVVSSEVDAGVAPGDPAATHANNSKLGTLSFDIDVSESGYYKMYAFAKTTTDNPINDFYVKIDDKEMMTWNITSNSNANEYRTNEDPSVEQFIDWDKGSHKIIFYQAAVGASLDRIIITKNIIPDFTEVTSNPLNYDSITFDLSKILGVEAYLGINLIKSLENTYTIQNPVLINPTEATIEIRGIYPLIDGKFIEQNSIFTDIDVLTNKPFEVLSLSSTILLLGASVDNPDPKISLNFDLLEISSKVVPETTEADTAK